MEGVEWIWQNGILTAQEICEDQQETEIEIAPTLLTRPSGKLQIREYKNFLSSIKENF
jgi:hypothetical protein